MSITSGDHTVTGGILQVDAVTDGKGVFLRRSALGAGNIPTATVTLRFSGSYTPASTNYEVIGIEMVHVPQGSFTVGDGSTSATFSTNSFGTSNSSATPFTISSEAGIVQDGLRNSFSMLLVIMPSVEHFQKDLMPFIV
ncbi:MAG: hypothetical protein HC913_21150 [Microscillaceae bacterium]|nr:hypothetical protein [Microscillaceae bacterium]